MAVAITQPTTLLAHHTPDSEPSLHLASTITSTNSSTELPVSDKRRSDRVQRILKATTLQLHYRVHAGRQRLALYGRRCCMASWVAASVGNA